MRTACVLLLLAAAASSGPELQDPERAALGACDRMELSEVKDLPLVEVTEVLYVGEDGPVLARGFAFVLGEEAGKVRISDQAYRTRTVVRADAPDEAGEARLAPLDLGAAVDRLLSPEPPDPSEIPFDSPGEADPWSARLVLAARCRALGRPDLARRLLDALEPWDERSGIETARETLADRLLWRTTLDFEDLSVTRAELLRRLRLWVECFDTTEHVDKAKGLLEELERMVPEDEEHAGRCPKGGGAPDERIADLVWHLRDARGGQFMQPGSPSVFLTRGDERNAAHDLEAVGWPAIPALLDALEDTRLTRTVGFWRDFIFSHYVVTVGGAAREVLADITHQRFRGEEWTSARIREWWEAYGPDGEVKYLRERCESATDWQRTEALKRLAARSAKDALEVAKADLARAKTSEERCAAARELATLSGDEATAALRALAVPPEPLHVRVTATIALRERGEPGTDEALRSLFREAAAPSSPEEPGTLRALVYALAEVGDADREALVRAARLDPERLGDMVEDAIMGLLLRRDGPSLRGAARDLGADLALRVLAVPPITALFPEERPHGPDRDHAAAALDRLRGGGAWDPKAPASFRLAAGAALVAAECRDRKLTPPPGPRLVAEVDAAAALDPLAVRAVFVAAGSRFEPTGEALLPVRALLGTVPDADSLFAAATGAFLHRPKGAGGVVLRARRTDGPWEVEVAWHATEREGVQIDQMTGDGDGYGWDATCGASGIGDEEIPEEQSLSPFLRGHVETLLRRAVRKGGIVDLGVRHN